MAELSVDELTKVVKDVAYVAIGFSVLAFQKAQVQRREFTEQFQTQVVDTARSQIADARDNLDKVTAQGTSQFEKLTGSVEDRVKLVEERVAGLEDRIDTMLDQVEAKLPEQAAEIVKQARDAAKDARNQVRSLVGRAA